MTREQAERTARREFGGVNPHDPLVFIVVCFSVAVTGALAAYIPSMRAASIDPMKALRGE